MYYLFHSNAIGLKKFIVCAKCNTTYDYDEIIDGSAIIKKCTKLLLPSHAGIVKRCNHPLVEKNNSNIIKPKKRYVYNSVKATLEKFFMRNNFEKQIEEWKLRTTVPGFMFDIYDGHFFKDFKKEGEDEPFINKDCSLMLSLNVDWFQPTKSMNYHVGAIYLVINNLPRAERYKQHNLILVGLMPGPNEPSLSDVNHFLRPMVDELIELYEGVIIRTTTNPHGKFVRCALASVNCDIPAAKKVCGFTAFNSFVPCHKCADKFPAQRGNPVRRCFSNVDCSSWTPRNKETNFQQAKLWKNAQTTTERKKIEQEYGVRWSELHRLQYFDIVRCTIIDGLHNLYLGTAKFMMDYWKTTNNFITSKDLFEMGTVEAKKIVVPPQYTTLGSKIAANFSGLKGDEYRSWTIVYSAILLKGRLVGEHMANWMRFVQANHLLSAPSITRKEIDDAHDLLVEFVKKNVELYGDNFITPNMHLHLHLKQTILDFGPIYSTWLYSFERANGDIKKIDINFKEGLEFTYMERYLQHVHLQDYLQLLPDIIKNNSIMMNILKLLLPGDIFKVDSSNSCYMDIDDSEPQQQLNNHHKQFHLTSFLDDATRTTTILTGSEPLPLSCFPLKSKKPIIMNGQHYECLVNFYKSVYSGIYNIVNINDLSSSSLPHTSVVVNSRISKFDQINILGQQFRSMESRTKRGAYVQAMSPAKEGVFRVGRILYFFSNDLLIPGDTLFAAPQSKQHLFAFIQWYQPSDKEFSSFDMHNIKVWKETFEPINALSILPIHQIHTCVAVMKHIDNTIIAYPLPRRTIGV